MNRSIELTPKDYLGIILLAISKNKFFLDALYREYKNAEANHIYLEEFMQGLDNAINFINEYFKTKEYEEIKLVNQYIIQQRQKGIEKPNEYKVLIENAKNSVPYFNPSHHNFDKYRGMLISKEMIPALRDRVNKLPFKIEVRDNYKQLKKLNNSEELNVQKANEAIGIINIDFYKEYFETNIIGKITIDEIAKIELNFLKNNIKDAESKGYGNNIRFYLHSLNTLKEYCQKNNIDISTNDTSQYTSQYTSQNENITDWKNLIKIELQDRLLTIEKNIDDKIKNWKQGKAKIECASFCELLFDKKYFNTAFKKDIELFSLLKYGVDIKIQLQSAKKDSRKTHKLQLNKHFS